MSYDAAELYDEALDIVRRHLKGEAVEAIELEAAHRVLQPVWTMIYLERSRGGFPSQIEDSE